MAKILVVDDSSTVRDEVSTFLKSSGLDVVTAVDGKDGLVKLKADPGIRLVVADVNMPNMDGLTMVEKIRSELGNNTVNLIMLTRSVRQLARGNEQPADFPCLCATADPHCTQSIPRALRASNDEAGRAGMHHLALLYGVGVAPA